MMPWLVRRYWARMRKKYPYWFDGPTILASIHQAIDEEAESWVEFLEGLSKEES